MRTILIIIGVFIFAFLIVYFADKLTKPDGYDKTVSGVSMETIKAQFEINLPNEEIIRLGKKLLYKEIECLISKAEDPNEFLKQLTGMFKEHLAIFVIGSKADSGFLDNFFDLLKSDVTGTINLIKESEGKPKSIESVNKIYELVKEK